MIMKMNYCQFWSSFMFNIAKDIRNPKQPVAFKNIQEKLQIVLQYYNFDNICN